MSLEHIQTPNAPAAIGPYSQGIVANGLLFTAGQIALDPATGEIVSGGVREQTVRVMQNLSAVLASAGVDDRGLHAAVLSRGRDDGEPIVLRDERSHQLQISHRARR